MTQNKKQILDYIYNSLDLSNFKYKILEYESDLQLLNQKHFVSANFSGTNCLLIFNNFRNVNCSVLVERKTLSYNQHQVVFNNVKMTDVNIKLDDSIYKGTIMDGIFFQNKRNGKKTFVITDVYVFRGQSLINDNMKHKIMNISAYISANMKISDLNLSVNVLYETDNILKLREDIKKIKDINVKGFVFYPVKSGTRLIFQDNKIPNSSNFNPDSNLSKNNFIQNQYHNHNNNQTQDQNKKNTIMYIAKDNKPIFATLEIRKTEQPDVYHVLCAEKDVIDCKNVIKIKKLGIAFIPDKKTSEYCRKIFFNKLNGRALFKCQFDTNKNKWIPLNENKNSKLPDLLENIEKNLTIVADS